MNINWYSIYDTTSGEISFTLTSDDDSIVANTPGGHSAIPGDCTNSQGFIQGGKFVAYTPEQAASKSTAVRGALWSNVTMGWVDQRSLVQAKADKWAAIKVERESRSLGTFKVGDAEFQVNESKITGAVLDAMIAKTTGETWHQPWGLVDNSVLTLDADQMIAVGRACKAYIGGLWAVSQTLRGQVDSATTAEGVAAVVWPLT